MACQFTIRVASTHINVSLFVVRLTASRQPLLQIACCPDFSYCSIRSDRNCTCSVLCCSRTCFDAPNTQIERSSCSLASRVRTRFFVLTVHAADLHSTRKPGRLRFLLRPLLRACIPQLMTLTRGSSISTSVRFRKVAITFHLNAADFNSCWQYAL